MDWLFLMKEGKGICYTETFNYSVVVGVLSNNQRKTIVVSLATCLGSRPSILAVKEIANRIIRKMKEYVEVFLEGMAA